MKYKYIIKIIPQNEKRGVLEWHINNGNEDLYEAIKFCVEFFMEEDDIITIERSEIDEQE